MANGMQVFDYETPQEAQEKQRKRFLQGLSTQQGNSLGQVGYVLGQALAGGFTEPPDVKRAKETEAAVKGADEEYESSIRTTPPVNDIDKEMRRLQILRDRVADVNPEAASQLNTQLLMLGEAKFQRDRLVSSDKREVEAHDLTVGAKRDEAVMRKLTGGLTYVIDQRSKKAKSFDLLDPKASADFQAEAAKPGTIVLTPTQVYDLYKMETQEALELRQTLAGSNDLSKVYVKDALRASDGLLGLYGTAERIFDVLSVNPDALTSTSKAANAVDRLATEFSAVARAANGATTKDGTSIDGWFKSNGITNTRMQGLVMGMAYALARANDPAGRISDKDLIAAATQLGADNPNPQAILANLNDNLTIKSNQLIDSLDSMPQGYQVEMKDRRELLGKKRATFNERFDKYAQGTARPATGIGVGQTPITPGPAGAGAPDKDGWTIVNGVKIRRSGGPKLNP